MTPARRYCFFIPASQFDEHGYIPSVVTEGEPGHTPLRGTGEAARPRPWSWGQTLAEAEQAAAEANARLGLSPEEVAEIILSSVAAQHREERAWQAAQDAATVSYKERR
jgi:hypothetical protein